MVKWVLLTKFCRLTGYTDDAARAKMQARVWPEGPMWRKSPDGRIHVNMRNYHKWVEGQEFALSAERPSKSTSAGRVNATASVSVLNPQRQI